MISLKKIKPVQPACSKRRNIYQSLRGQILSDRLPPGSRFPTAHRLAERFKVSYVTIHSALNDLVRDGWLTRHQGKGTFLAARAGRGKARPLTSHVAVILPRQEDIVASGNADIVLSLLHGCGQGAILCGSDLAMVTLSSELSSEESRSSLERMLRYDGVILIGTQYGGLISELARKKFPFVILAGEGTVGIEVNYDRQTAVELGVRHLVDHGYRRIGFLGTIRGPDSVKFDFFRQNLETHGLALNLRWVESCRFIHDAYEAARRFLDRAPLPDAVLADNELKAEALVRVLQERGLRVPEDLAVVGYGTEHPSDLTPPLTMVLAPSEAMGREGILLLDQLIRGGITTPVRRILQPRMLVRQSCGCRAKEKIPRKAGIGSRETEAPR